jgi:SAM-dependent methyltransferase
MIGRLRTRADAQELMDEPTAGGPARSEAYRHLRRLNRLFGAAGPVVYGVKRLWRAAGKPRRLSVLDIGAGSGDVNRRLLRWARANGIALTVTLADVSAEACEEARRLFRGDPRVRVERRDVFELPEAAADVVTGTQFLHHFPSPELPRVVARMAAASRIGVVVTDIHRHWLAWTAVWLVTRLVSSNRFIRTDGPLSVARGFTADDWRDLGRKLGVPERYYAWRPLFRYAAVIRKEEIAMEQAVEAGHGL